MKKSNIMGFVCAEEERTAVRYAAPVGIAIMLFFAFLFWSEVFRNIDSLIHWALAATWTLFIAYLIIQLYSSRDIYKLQFGITKSYVSNFDAKKRLELDLSEDLFITKLTRDFSYGKATVEKTFYLFSGSPFRPENIKGQGLSVIMRLNKYGIIILPQNDEVKAWMVHEFKNIHISNYPKISFKTGDKKTDKTGDGLREPY